MSRRKHLAPRYLNGKTRPALKTELMSPAEVRRMAEAAQAGLRDAMWGTTIGRLYLTGKVSASEYGAAKRWVELVAGYSTACQSPQPPRTAVLDATGGTPIDPDSISGIKQARQHERATASYLPGRHALRLAGPTAERVVGDVVELGQAPAGQGELEALRTGLQSLSRWWADKRKGPR
jgi:hypothetical protein